MLARQALYQRSHLANPASSLLKGDELEFQNILLISWESHRISLDLVNGLLGYLWRGCFCKPCRLGICFHGAFQASLLLSCKGLSRLSHPVISMSLQCCISHCLPGAFGWEFLGDSAFCFWTKCWSGWAYWLIIYLTWSCLPSQGSFYSVSRGQVLIS